MKIVRAFTQGREEYLVSEDNRVFRIGKTYRQTIRFRGDKPYLDSETTLKEMKNFVV